MFFMNIKFISVDFSLFEFILTMPHKDVPKRSTLLIEFLEKKIFVEFIQN